MCVTQVTRVTLYEIMLIVSMYFFMVIYVRRWSVGIAIEKKAYCCLKLKL